MWSYKEKHFPWYFLSKIHQFAKWKLVQELIIIIDVNEFSWMRGPIRIWPPLASLKNVALARITCKHTISFWSARLLHSFLMVLTVVTGNFLGLESRWDWASQHSVTITGELSLVLHSTGRAKSFRQKNFELLYCALWKQKEFGKLAWGMTL